MPEKAIVHAAINMVRSLPGYPGLSVLDISCGDAEILEQLLAEGCRTEGTHYRENDYIVTEGRKIPEGVILHRGVDLSRALPFPDHYCDVVIMTEVMEHLDAHVGIIHEIGRILRPGGYLVFSTPNLNRLSSRWRFFLTGCHRINQRRIGWDIPRERLYAYHLHIPELPMLHPLLHQAGLMIERMACTRIEPEQYFWMLFYPLIRLATLFQVRGRSKYPDIRNQGERDLYRWLVHPAALMSKQLLLLARKHPETPSA